MTASARTQCPKCHGARVAALNAILFAANADFFQCEACGHLWHVQKGQDGPASRSLLGTGNFTRPASATLEKRYRVRLNNHT
jgi:uncharacterized protein (DUF983 family)